MGYMLVNWLWGGFAVNNALLSRFFSLRFMLLFIIAMLSMIHFLLHSAGSNNPIGINSNIHEMPFIHIFPLDIMGIAVVITTLLILNLMEPYKLSDPDNFIPKPPMVTANHIQPQWYFLIAYSILRSIPNKLGGVMALVLSILMLVILPFSMKSKFKGIMFNPISQMNFWLFAVIIILLTWIGARPMEIPFINTALIFTIMYFTYFMKDPMLTKYEVN